MKNIIFLLISFVIFLSAHISAETTEFAFRGSKWAFTIDQVKAAEKITPLEEGPNYLIYEVVFMDQDAEMSYFFDSEGLLRSCDYNIWDQLDYGAYKTLYDNIKIMVTEILGPVKTEEVQSLRYQYSIEEWDELMEAIAHGDASLNTVWLDQEKKTLCYLSIMPNENRTIFFCIEFIRLDPIEGIFE